MDYEEKYKEALERARALRNEAIEKEYAVDYIKDYETIFPELRESEDERIRRNLIKFLTCIKEISKSGRTTLAIRKEDAEMCECFLDYLKKEKVQKPAEWSEEDKAMIECLIRHTQKEFDELCNDRYGHQEIISDLKESCRERMNWLENRLKSFCPS